MPKVSFISSNYNTPVDQLRAALDSMLAQTFEDFEIVIVNDGSADASAEVLRGYAAKYDKIKLIENEKNLGLPASLNRALDACGGEYAARMDTDDICLPDRLERQVAFMDENPDLLFSGAWSDRFSGEEKASVGSWEPVMCPDKEYPIRLMLDSAPLMIHPTVIFRMSLLNEYGLRYSEDAAFRYCEDYEFWTRCARLGKADIMQATVLRYRFDDNDFRITSTRADDMAVCQRNVRQRLFAELGVSMPDKLEHFGRQALRGRKEYDKGFKKFAKLLLKGNAKKKIYDQAILKTLLRGKWFETCYYGIAYEKSFTGKIKILCSLYPSQYPKMINAIIKKTFERRRRKSEA